MEPVRLPIEVNGALVHVRGEGGVSHEQAAEAAGLGVRGARTVVVFESSKGRRTLGPGQRVQAADLEPGARFTVTYA